MITGLVVNIAMLTAGIGLVRRKLWGIRLGIWTALSKIARLLLLYTYFALVIVPPLAQTAGRFAGEMFLQQQQAMGRPAPAGLDANMWVKMYSVSYSS